MEEVEVVIAHEARATLRVGGLFLKVDPDAGAMAREVEAMGLAPVPTPEVAWVRPPVLALHAVEGTPLARLGEPSTASAAAWVAVGATVRALHDAPLPPWPSRRGAERGHQMLDDECAWLVANDVVPADVVDHNRALALVALQERQPVFVHGDLHVAHVLVHDDEVAGVLDWSEAGRGDAAYDLASLTLGHRERLDDLLDGYGDVDREAVRGGWSLRCLTATRWLLEHGFDAAAPGCEIDVLRSQAAD